MPNLLYALSAGAVVMLSSILGSVIMLFIKKVSHKTCDAFMGFAAGVMLAAAVLGLLPRMLPDANIFGIAISVTSVLAGCFLISILDRLVPHTHSHAATNTPDEGVHTSGKAYSNGVLLIAAIAIHNVPEGLAVGVSFSDGLTRDALLMTISIAVQKVPEGAIVALPLVMSGMKRTAVFRSSLIVALMVLPGVLLGTAAAQIPVQFMSFSYALTFGAMLYVISDEIIPASHSHGYQKAATFSLVLGFMGVFILDALL